MYRSKFSLNLCLVVLAAGFLGLAGCSNQAANEASNQAPNSSAQASKASPAPSKKASAKSATTKVIPASAKVTQPPQPITIPKGTEIAATIGETLASDKTHKGDSFIAMLAAPVKVDGKTILPKGAHVTGQVVNVKKHEVKVTLASVVVHGKSYDLTTNSLRPSDKTKPENVKDNTSAQSGNKNADKPKKDNSTLSAKTELTFKLTKPLTVPAKG